MSCHLITQNVDQLQQGGQQTRDRAARDQQPSDLHELCCFSQPGYSSSRCWRLQNPDTKAWTDIIKPDGDVELTPEEVGKPKCQIAQSAEGILKPYVVFSVTMYLGRRVEEARREVTKSDKL